MGNASRAPGGGSLKRIKVASTVGTLAKYVSVDMKSLLPERTWKKLTIENFGAQVVKNQVFNGYGGGTSTGNSTYDPETGILNWFTGTWPTTEAVPGQITCDIYCWYVD